MAQVEALLMRVAFVARGGFGPLLQDRLRLLEQDHECEIQFVPPREAERIYSWWDGYDKEIARIVRDGVDAGKIVEIYSVDGEPAGQMIELIP